MVLTYLMTIQTDEWVSRPSALQSQMCAETAETAVPPIRMLSDIRRVFSIRNDNTNGCSVIPVARTQLNNKKPYLMTTYTPILVLVKKPLL